jgi:hypothetical protein
MRASPGSPPKGERVEPAEAGYHVVLPGRDDHRAGPRHRRAPLAQDPPRCAELGIRAVAATATQVGWGRDVHAFASGDRNGAVVYDRRTGKQLLRHFGDKGVFLRSEASGS